MNTHDVHGLILSGGKSTRMGSDKGTLHYHGLPQREYLFDLASQYCPKVFYSIREDQINEFQGHPYIQDHNDYRGPLNGILSAHKQFPEKAWLVLACDLPLLDASSISDLVAARDIDKTATSFATKTSGLPEPLVSIWEPKGLQKAIEYMQEAKSSCPRRFLIHSDIKLVYPDNDQVLYNANSIGEYEHAINLIEK